ncbi:TniQ family protein [Ciceribacter sp. L1K22]|uniref:TniQ family protein n=1 Tax=Ciceribacter sp. L1K22 TaxID=2820275 RepID=UPI001ABDF52C|nr:TniQ family protein [Ciceribacter sp. L1K22]MBO3760136.1 TniQ family protein [Ciceribacter sp. L1K22]
MVLPVTLEYHADETAIDFVARLAAANGFSSLRSFLGHTDVTARAIVKGDADALALVTEWSGVSVSRLQTLAVVASGAGETWRMGHATLSKDMRLGRRHRLCARCVMEDRKRMSGRNVSRAYRRAWWSVRGIEGCHLHDCALLEVSVGSEDDVHDFPRFVEANLAQIEAAGAAPLPSRQPMLDRYLRERVFQGGGASFLDALDVHVAAEFSRYLGDVLALHQVREWMSEGTDLREWGFCLAMKGEDEIRRTIAQVIDRDRPMAKYVGQVLGPMAQWLRRNLCKDAYQPIVDLMQDILVRNMPFGPGQTILRPVEVRYLHSVTSAHAEHGLTHDRIRALMRANDPSFRNGLSDACTYFDAGALRPILEAASDTLTATEASAALGMREERVHDLLEAGILTQVETRSPDERTYTRIRKEAVEDLKHRLELKMTEVAQSEGLIPLVAASRTWRRPFHKLVAMILEGTLAASIVPGSAPVLQRARVAADALKLDVSPLGGSNDDLMRLKEVEIALATTTSTVADLIKRGYLRQRTIRRETGRTVRFVERCSLAEFQAAYASLTEIAKYRSGYRAAIKAELDSVGIAPIFEPEGFIARFYRRTDVTSFM